MIVFDHFTFTGEVKNAIDTLRSNGVKAFVLDLRNNRYSNCKIKSLAHVNSIINMLLSGTVVAFSQKELRLQKFGKLLHITNSFLRG